MKKSISIALLSIALAAPLLAHAEGAYVGANLGRSELKANADGLGSFKDKDSGFKLYGGYGLTPNFGVELGYVELGKGSADIGGISQSAKPKSFYLAATGTLPVNTQFSLTAKVGVSSNRTKFDSGLGSSSESDTSAIFGVGATYSLMQNVSLVAEYENFGKVFKENGGDLKANLLSVGLRYQF